MTLLQGHTQTHPHQFTTGPLQLSVTDLRDTDQVRHKQKRTPQNSPKAHLSQVPGNWPTAGDTLQQAHLATLATNLAGRGLRARRKPLAPDGTCPGRLPLRAVLAPCLLAFTSLSQLLLAGLSSLCGGDPISFPLLRTQELRHLCTFHSLYVTPLAQPMSHGKWACLQVLGLTWFPPGPDPPMSQEEPEVHICEIFRL